MERRREGLGGVSAARWALGGPDSNTRRPPALLLRPHPARGDPQAEAGPQASGQWTARQCRNTVADRLLRVLVDGEWSLTEKELFRGGDVIEDMRQLARIVVCAVAGAGLSGCLMAPPQPKVSTPPTVASVTQRLSLRGVDYRQAQVSRCELASTGTYKYFELVLELSDQIRIVMAITPYARPGTYPIVSGLHDGTQPVASVMYELPPPSTGGEMEPQTTFWARTGTLTVDTDMRSGTVDASFQGSTTLKGSWRCT